MRWLLWICLVVAWIAVTPASAAAKPKVAVAPLEGDDDGEVTGVVADEARAHASVTGPDSVKLPDSDTPKAMKKLRSRLAVDAVLHGKVSKAGRQKRLTLTVSGRGKPDTFELVFKKANTKAFRKELRKELEKRIEAASKLEAKEDKDDDDEDDKPKKLDDGDRPKKHDDETKRDDDRPKKHDDDERPKKHDDEAKRDDDRPKKHDDDERPKKRDDERPKKRVAAEDDDDTRVTSHSRRKKHHRGDDDEDLAEGPPRNIVTQSSLWLDGGGTGQRRTLTYTTTGTGGTPPPRVGTASFAASIEGEVYPAAFSSLKGAAAGFGIAGSFGKSLGLGIKVPGTTVTAPINEGHYSIGLRYRLVFGGSSVAIGAAYWRQQYIADRSALMTGQTLDMPDTDYSAIAPGVLARIGATPKIGVLLGLDVPLLLSSGPIATNAQYGAATAIAFVVQGGVDIALARNYGLRFAGVFDQVGLSFKGAARGVTAATDRTMGVMATFAVIY